MPIQEFRARGRTRLSELFALAEKAVANWDWSTLKQGDFAVVIAAAMTGKVQCSKELLRFIDAELEATTRPVLLGALCEAYMENWEVGADKTRRLAKMIIGKSASLPARWQVLFRRYPQLLDTERGAEALGHILAVDNSPFETLRSAGLPAPHGPGMMTEVHEAFIHALSPAETKATVDRILGWIAPAGQPKLIDVRAISAVRAILSPWRDRNCPEALRLHCVKELNRLFGDPRHRDADDSHIEEARIWLDLGHEYLRVMLKWLAGQSMEAIFEIVSRAESIRDTNEQWIKRKRFWMDLYKRGRIDEAWLALGKDSETAAANLYRRTGDPAYRNFGRQRSRSDTSILMMRIGEKIVVEGSHSFRVHVFDKPVQERPELYATDYDLGKIVLPLGDARTRVHDTGGNWMSWVMERIR
nr:EH signature domain-containing protein [Marinicella sp. W31]MDC2877024.1 EH signature domain-containing protein [Marinicella sp. W31]